MASTAGDVQPLIELAQYHNDASDGLSYFLSDRFRNKDLRFLGLTPAEFQDLVSTRIDETELRSSLAMLALLEAKLRIDFRTRVKQRRKDPLSKAFRSFGKQSGQKIRFDDLLDLWSLHHPRFRRILSEFRATLHLRHWLAHGRYWEKPSHGRFDYFAIYSLSEVILTAFPLLSDN